MATTKKANTNGVTAPKKAVSKEASKRNLKKAKRVLVCAIGEQCFWTHDGTIISNLVELRDAFEAMEQEVFAYHANKTKNDFADWVHYVLGDSVLADKLRRAAKASSARTVVVSGLKMYDV